MNCIFCRIRDGEVPAIKVYEDDRTLAIMDINPLNDGHTLVLTKAHVGDLYELSPVDCGAVLLTAKLVAVGIRQALHPEGLNLLQANGPAAYQSVPHFHMHVIPRWMNDGKGLEWSLSPGNTDRIREIAEEIRKEIPAL